MITPKPKTVVELFEGHPERWCQIDPAQDINGYPCGPLESQAVCFCIRGAIMFIYGNPYAKVKNLLIENKISLAAWNDAPERTFEEVLAKCKELEI